MPEFDLGTVLERLRLQFKERLGRKTNWGRNEVQLELQIAVGEVLADLHTEKFSAVSET